MRHGLPEAARLQLAIQLGRGVRTAPASRPQLRRWISAVLQRPATLTLRFVNRDEARRLNVDYRDRDYAPDVLTFAYSRSDDERVLADLAICLPVAREQARQAGLSERARLAHLVMHGTLHAQGLDHERADEAAHMEAIEVAALARFRIANPYA
jgi:probable rRNA maturation factor